MSTHLYPFAIGAGTVVVLLLAVCTLVGTNPLRLVEGQDGRASTSKFQWLLWTAVILFSYVAIYSARALSGNVQPVSSIPQNVLLALGLSAGTMVAAKGITASFVNSGKLAKASVGSGVLSALKGLVVDDGGVPDLSKVQILGWTLVAVGVYINSVIQQINRITGGSDAGSGLPDIDSALMVLMGLSQAAYLGKKAVTTDPMPRLIGLTTRLALPGASVTILGANLGAAGAGTMLAMDGTPIPTTNWSNDTVTFTVPQRHPGGADWALSQVVSLTVTVSGRAVPSALLLNVRQALAAADVLAATLGGNGAGLAALLQGAGPGGGPA